MWNCVPKASYKAMRQTSSVTPVKSEQSAGVLQRNIVARAVPPVNFSIIEDRRGCLFAFFERGQHLMVMLQKRIDQRNQLPGDTPDQLLCAPVAFCPGVIAAFERQEALVECAKFRVMANRGHRRQIKEPSHANNALSRQIAAIGRGTGLDFSWCPAAIALEIGGTAEVGNGTDGRDQYSGLNHADARNAREYLVFATTFHNGRDFHLEVGTFGLQEAQFCDEMLLFQQQTVQAISILYANAFPCQTLQFHQLLFRRKAPAAQCTQVVNGCAGQQRRGRKMLSICQRNQQVRVLENARELWKHLVANRSQAIETRHDANGHVLIVVRQRGETQRVRGGREQGVETTSCFRLYPQGLLIVEQTAEGLRVATVAFLFAAVALLHVEHGAGDTLLVKKLQERVSIVAGVFHQHGTFSKRGKAAHTSRERLEAAARLREVQQSRSLCGVLVREEGRDARGLADVDSNVEFHIHILVFCGRDTHMATGSSHSQMAGVYPDAHVRGIEASQSQSERRGLPTVARGMFHMRTSMSDIEACLYS